MLIYLCDIFKRSILKIETKIGILIETNITYLINIYLNKYITIY